MVRLLSQMLSVLQSMDRTGMKANISITTDGMAGSVAEPTLYDAAFLS